MYFFFCEALSLTLEYEQIGINALDALVTAYNALGLLRQQTAPTSRVHCIITNGGQAANSTSFISNKEQSVGLKQKKKKWRLEARGIDQLPLSLIFFGVEKKKKK